MQRKKDLASLMFFIKEYSAQVDRQAGHFVVRAQGRHTRSGDTPCVGSRRAEIKAWRGKRLKAVV